MKYIKVCMFANTDKVRFFESWVLQPGHRYGFIKTRERDIPFVWTTFRTPSHIFIYILNTCEQWQSVKLRNTDRLYTDIIRLDKKQKKVPGRRAPNRQDALDIEQLHLEHMRDCEHDYIDMGDRLIFIRRNTRSLPQSYMQFDRTQKRKARCTRVGEEKTLHVFGRDFYRGQKEWKGEVVLI